MDALTAYRRLHDAGLTLDARDDRLLVGPSDRLTDDLRTMVRAHKQELLRLMADAHATTEDLIAWAMKTCDRYGDGPAAREEMRRQCVETPPHLQPDLLDHFRRTNGENP
jgi:hypothetical protein